MVGTEFEPGILIPESLLLTSLLCSFFRADNYVVWQT